MDARLAPDAPDLVWFRGPDTVRFLNDIISQEIDSMEPGTVRRSFLLNPQGRIDHLMWVLRGQDEVGLVTDAGRGGELASSLGRYRIRVDVEIGEEAGSRWLVVGPFGDIGMWSRGAGGLAADVSWTGVPRFLVVGERPDLPAIDAGELERLRIEAGEPLVGVDTSNSTIPQETGLVPVTVDLDKGCFLGQELVGRIARRGHVNKHLRVLEFGGSAPGVGTEVRHGELTVGSVTSVAGSVGLATLRREVEVGESVSVDGVEAVVAR
jgi:folate-binding protein YgfZ